MAIDKMANALDDTLSKAGLSPMVLTTQQVKNLGQNQLQIVYYLLDAVAAIVALVGILGMFNTLTTSVLERRREIGILRSMGATGRRVGWVFWLEAISLAVFAWLVAIVIGIPGSKAFVSLISAQLYAVDFTFNPLQVVEMLIFIILIATLASFGPVLKASRVRIADTLRYE
jgi:putative ABC transport system permease protein